MATSAKTGRKFVQLDTFDKKIIYQLNKDGRQTLAAVGKGIRKSVDFVFYRLKRLKKEGLYVDDMLIFDPSKLGYQSYELSLQVDNHLSMPAIIAYLKAAPQVWVIDRLVGQYQLLTSVYVQTVDELEEVLSDLGSKFGEAISNYRLLLLYAGYSAPHNYLFAPKDMLLQPKLRLAAKKVMLTSTELQILGTLAQTPRASFHAIAATISSTIPRVRRIYADLCKKQVILEVRPALNTNLLPYIHKHVLIKVRFGALKLLKEIKNYLVGLRTTKAVYLTLGSFDLTGRFIFEDLDEFYTFKEQLYVRYGPALQSFVSDDYYEDIDYGPGQSLALLTTSQSTR